MFQFYDGFKNCNFTKCGCACECATCNSFPKLKVISFLSAITRAIVFIVFLCSNPIGIVWLHNICHFKKSQSSRRNKSRSFEKGTTQNKTKNVKSFQSIFAKALSPLLLFYGHESRLLYIRRAH